MYVQCVYVRRLGEHAHSTATTPTFKRQLPYVPRDLQKMSRERGEHFKHNVQIHTL